MSAFDDLRSDLAEAIDELAAARLRYIAFRAAVAEYIAAEDERTIAEAAPALIGLSPVASPGIRAAVMVRDAAAARSRAARLALLALVGGDR